MFRRLCSWLFWSLLAVVGLAVVVLVGLYFAVEHEPQFYREQAAVDPVERQRASDELLAKTAAATSTARREGEWSIELTDEQINGWLAVTLPQQEQFHLPELIREPRVQFQAGRIIIASRVVERGVEAVLSLECEPTLVEPNELVLRVRSFKCGAVPLPTQRLLDLIGDQINDAGAPVKWSQQEGDPVARVALPAFTIDGGRAFRIEAIELKPGSIRLSAQATDDAAAQVWKAFQPAENAADPNSGA